MGDREDWLALNPETALEPDLPICDPHHHWWEYPGSRYLLEEFGRDLSGGHNIVSTVFVECLQKYRADGPEPLRPVGETEFVDALAEQSSGRMLQGIVGFADLSLGTRVREVLEAHLQSSARFRGIRYASAWHASDKIHNAHTNPPQGLLLDSAFRDGFSMLADLGLTFDAWLFHNQIPELLDLAMAFPETTIVLDHMAGPLGIGPFTADREEVFREWRNAMSTLAGCRNVLIKLGGRAMTMAGYGWHKREQPPGSVEMAEAMGPYFDACIELFGADRCMLESNFPVDRASCSYTNLWNAFKRITAGYSESERAALFHDSATQAYRLSVRNILE